jgi:hypothetical protein
MSRLRFGSDESSAAGYGGMADDLRGEVLGVGWCGCGIEDEHATDLEGQAAGCGNRMSNGASGKNYISREWVWVWAWAWA